MSTEILFFETIYFFIVLIIIGISTIKDRGVLFFPRTIGVVLSFIVITSFPLSYFKIKLVLSNYLLVLTAITCLMYAFYCFRNKKIISPVNELKKIKFEKKNTIIALLFLIIPVMISLIYFGDLGKPRYLSLDAAYHFMLGKYINENHQLLIFNKDLYFKDPIVYPFGASVITSFISSLFSSVSYMKIYQFLNMLFFALVCAYFTLLSQKKLPFKTKTGILLFLVLNCFGFFFNLMAFGFFAQLVGLFFLLLFVDLYPEIRNTITGSIFSGIILSALFFTYIYWVPIAVLFILMYNFNLENIKKSIADKKLLLNLLIVGLTFIAISTPYIITLYNFRFLRFISNNGGTYKTFFLNFALLTPFIIAGGFITIKNWIKENNPISAFFLSSAVFFFVLYILYAVFGIASQYSLAKSYYLFGPILYYISVIGIESIFLKIKSDTRISIKIEDPHDINKNREFNIKKIGYIFTAIIAFIIILITLSPLIINDSFNINKSPLTEMRTWGLNGRFFDIFYLNSKLIKENDLNTNRIKISTNQLFFFKHAAKHISNNTTKVMVIANPDYSFWFYAMTWIWPRTAIDGSESIWKKLPEYNVWLTQREGNILILLDTPETKEWVIKNNFNFDNYETIYRKGQNYILKLKNDSSYNVNQ